MRQSELEANICTSSCNPAPSEGKRVRASRDWFSFTSDWSRKWREIFYQSQSEVKQNESKTRITFDAELKTALIKQELGE